MWNDRCLRLNAGSICFYVYNQFRWTNGASVDHDEYWRNVKKFLSPSLASLILCNNFMWTIDALNINRSRILKLCNWFMLWVISMRCEHTFWFRKEKFSIDVDRTLQKRLRMQSQSSGTEEIFDFLLKCIFFRPPSMARQSNAHLNCISMSI